MIFRHKPRLSRLGGHRTAILSHNLLTILGFSLVFRNLRLMWLGATLGIENSGLYGDRTSDSTWRETGRWTGTVLRELAQPTRKSQRSLPELPHTQWMEADPGRSRI